LNLVSAADAANAAILVANKAIAIGQVYNVNSDERITAKTFLNTIALLIGEKPLVRSVPFWLSYVLATILEAGGRLLSLRTPPVLTRYTVFLIAQNNVLDSSKVRRELGWKASVRFKEGLAKANNAYLHAHMKS